MAKKLVKAHKEANIDLKDGVQLQLPAGALSEDTEITSAKIISDDRVEIHLGPTGLEFSDPVVLVVTKQFLKGIGRVVPDLFGPDSKVKKIPGEDFPGRIEYKLKHLSIYYYRRR